MDKQCKKHGITKHAWYGKRWRCKACNVVAVVKRRRKIKAQALEYLGGRCQRCGYSKSRYSLAFHHLDPEHKDFTISDYGHTKSWARVKEELDKCMLVCHNCHGELHEELEHEA